MSGFKLIDQIAVEEFDTLGLLFACGNLKRTLAEIPPLYAESNIHFGDVQKDNTSDILFAFSRHPPVEFSVARFPNGRSTYFSYGLGLKETRDILDGFISKTEFEIAPFDMQAWFSNVRVIALQKMMYVQLKRASSRLTIPLESPLEKLWGSAQYGNFLHRCINYSMDQATLLAAKEYGLPKNIFGDVQVD